jgi:tetracycline 7-halogenase / FADH2 O2-dependent halogenase
VKAESYDFVVIGSGFGGAIMSMVLRRLGKSVLLLERGAHPRFAIGESSTPFANLLLEKLAEDCDLPFLRSLSEWGRWRDTFPELPVGLKRGFTFYYHTPGASLDFTDRARQLLVAASPNDRVADTHWYRPAFDAFLVQKAQELGVDYLDHATVTAAENHSTHWTFTVSRNNRTTQVRAGFVIDATGPSGFAPLGVRSIACPFMPPTSAVYAHFRDVPRLDEIMAELRDPRLPYPPDDAAVHHVFPGGWIWVLRFNNGITSAGAAFNADRLSALQVPTDSALSASSLWHSILRQFPTLAGAFRSATPITPFCFTPQLSFRREKAAGPNWAALPSASGFVDPLLSTGFALTLLGISRLGDLFRKSAFDPKVYEDLTFGELDAAADLVSALYSKMHAPEEFSLLSLVYFAAMSFSETAWRLGKRELASGFLLTNDADFSAGRSRLCAQARAGQRITREAITSIIEPFDVAGLTDFKRHPWYPVDFNDLRKNAHKIQADEKLVWS